MFDELPNLQLMEGPVNISKQDKLPLEWIEQTYPDVSARDSYRVRHDLGDIPSDVKDFRAFFEARRTRIGNKLRTMLGVATTD